MPDQGDPIWGAEERFAEAVELGRPPSGPIDAGLARDLEIAEMFRALGPSLSAGADAKARVRARVLATLAVDGPSSNGGARAPEARLTAPERLTGPDSTPTEQFPVISPSEDEPAEDAPVTTQLAVTAPAVTTHAPTTVAAGSGPSTAVMSEPDVIKALRPGRRRRHALPSRPSARPSPGAASIRRRIMVVGAAALMTVIAIAGGGIFASRDSVPGDPLYAMKRAAEAASGIFTGGNASKGQRNLDLAATRLDEIEEMVRESADPELISSALQDFDDATSAGSRLELSGEDAASNYNELATWSTNQSARLAALRSSLPASAQPAADDSLRLLERVHRRVTALSARSSCAQVTSGTVDDIGQLPATGPCVARQAGGGSAPASDPAARRASGSSNAQETGTPSSAPERDGSPDPALVPDGSVGTSPDDESGSTTTTTEAPRSSKNAGVPLPLPIPITLPALPGKLLG